MFRLKFQNARGASSHPAFVDIFWTCSHRVYPYQSSEWIVITLLHEMFKTRDFVAIREVPLEKNVELKCMQVNILKSVKRMTQNVVTYKLTRLISSV